MWQCFKKLTLFQQFIIFFVVVALIPLGSLPYVTYRYSKKSLISKTTQNLHALVDQEAFYIEHAVQEAKKLLHQIALLPALSSLGEVNLSETQRNNLKKQVKALIGKHLKEYQKKSPYKYIAFVLGDQPIYQKGSSHFTSKEIRSYIRQTQKTYPINYDPSSKSLLFGVPLVIENLPLATLLLQIPLSFPSLPKQNLSKTYSAINKIADRHIGFFDSNQQLALAKTLNPKKDENNFESTEENTLSLNLLKHSLNSNKPFISNDLYENPILIYGKKLTFPPGWFLISSVDIDEVLEPLNELEYLAYFSIFSVAVLGFSFSFLIYRSLTRRFGEFKENLNKLNEGKLDSLSADQSLNEFDQLASSLNQIAKKLQKADHKLKEGQNRLLLQEKLASLGLLTAGIVHEIKNPLHLIKNFNQIAKEQIEEVKTIKDPKELEETLSLLNKNLEKIDEHSKRAENTIRTMLDFSRGQSENKRLTDIHSLLEEYTKLAYHGMRAQDLYFNVKITKRFKEKISPIEIIPQDVGRVFLNLLNNAFYAVTEQKKKKNDPSFQPEVILETVEEDQSIKIIIKDNGTGIPKDKLKKVFNPFYTTKPAEQGTGLGLYLSKEIIEKEHKGTLLLESKEGETTFTIILPKQKVNSHNKDKTDQKEVNNAV